MQLNKLSVNKTIINGSLFSIFSFINQGIAFVLLIVLANYIAPAEYGRLSLYNTVVTFIGYIIAFSTTGYMSISYFKCPPEEFHKDFSIIIIITSAVFTLLIFFLLALSKQLSLYLYLPRTILFSAVVISFFSVLYNLNLDYFRVLEKVGIYGLLSCSFALLNFILSLLLVIKCNMNWQGRVYAQLGCSIAFGIFAIFSFKKYRLYNFKAINWKRIKYILLWGIPLIPHLAALWLRQGFDRYIINSHYNIAEVGLFSFALNLANVIISIGLAFNASNSVNIFKELSLDKPFYDKIRVLKKQSRLIVLVYLIATLFVIIGCSIFVPWLLPKYVSAMGYFYVLAVYGFIQCIYFLICNYLFYYRKNKEIMCITFSTAILHLSMSLILTRYSLYLTCFIYVFIEALIVILVYWRSKQAIHENLK